MFRRFLRTRIPVVEWIHDIADIFLYLAKNCQYKGYRCGGVG